MNKKVFFAVPAYKGIRCVPFYESLEATISHCQENGWQTALSVLQGSCYVQTARNELVKAFLDTDCDSLFFLDDDISWDCKDFLKLLEMPDDIVAGIYPYKTEEEGYPVVIHTDLDGIPEVREDGCIQATFIPFGFVRIKRRVIEKLWDAYQSLKYYKPAGYNLIEFRDLFPQGVQGERWVGEDYAFCNLWHGLEGEIIVVPDITLSHHTDQEVFTGNYHEFLLKQPGGSNYIPSPDKPLYSGNSVEGWLTYPEQQFLYENASKVESVLEVGSYKGKSSTIFCESTAKKIYCVDNWQAYGDIKGDTQEKAEGRYQEFLKNMAPYLGNGRVKVLRQSSMDASREFENKSLDMVFIDASHDYENVLADIMAWLPKVKKILCGHDYAYYWPGVKQAVNEIFGEDAIKTADSIWYVEVGQ